MDAVGFLIVLAVFWLLYKLIKKPGAPKVAVATPYVATNGTNQSDDTIGSDTWEGSFWDVATPLNVRAALKIDYIDGSGQASERVIEVRRFGQLPDGRGLILAHCQLRRATRTFKLERINRCVDEETGEIIDNVAEFLQRKYQESPQRSVDELLESDYDTLRVLLYVGKADGQLRGAEKAVIAETCRSLSQDSRITDQMVGRLFADLEAPSLSAFRLAVGRLDKRNAQAKNSVLLAAQKIVATQKTIHPTEQDALNYLQERLTTQPKEPHA